MMLTSDIAQYWRNKLKNKQSIEFPGKLCDAIADITDDFSFAYLKEAFVATLLELARKHGDDDDEESYEDGDDDEDPLEKYEFWRVFKAQVKILRDDMGSETITESSSKAGETAGAYEVFPAGYEEMMSLLEKMRLQGSSHDQQLNKVLFSQGAAESNADPISRLARSGSHVVSPIHSFAPLAQTKPGMPANGAWGWTS
jgi:transitional endoplasmic reticulum ATPase